MSSLQDIPLAEMSENSLPSTAQATSTPKSNSLKRLFKLGNKKLPSAPESCEDVSIAEVPEIKKEPAMGGGGGGAAKANTLSRFFTRMKGSQRQDGLDMAAATLNKETDAENPEVTKEVEESAAPAPATEKPLPNAKPTLKTSISSYWKLLFNRQKAAANQQAKANSVEAQQSVHHVDEVHELEMVQQEQEHQLDLVTEQPHDASTDANANAPLPGPSAAGSTITMITTQQEQTKSNNLNDNMAARMSEILHASMMQKSATEVSVAKPGNLD